MKFNIFLLSILFAANVPGIAQSNMDAVLKSVEQNNKTLKTRQQYTSVKQLMLRTGLYPSNPRVNYDYMSGTPEGAGNQKDILITQEFEFPTVYFKQKQLAGLKSSAQDIESAVFRQNLLLEAKQVLIQIVHRNRLRSLLSERLRQGVELQKILEKRLEKGDAGMLDLNKSKLYALEVRQQFSENEAESRKLEQQLIELNGGQKIEFNDTIYPYFEPLPALESLEGQIEEQDLNRKFLEQEIQVSRKGVELAYAKRLPALETGYHYQGILGQTFRGFHAGISLPLWENKNVVKLKKTEVSLAELRLQEHLNEHFSEIKQLYDRFIALQEIHEQYKRVLEEMNANYLLDKAFRQGHIGNPVYFTELAYFDSAHQKMLTVEMEMHHTLAKLFRFKL